MGQKLPSIPCTSLVGSHLSGGRGVHSQGISSGFPSSHGSSVDHREPAHRAPSGLPGLRIRFAMHVKMTLRREYENTIAPILTDCAEADSGLTHHLRS